MALEDRLWIDHYDGRFRCCLQAI